MEIGALTNTVCLIVRIKLSFNGSETDDSTDLTWGTYTASGTGTDVKAKAVPVDPGDATFGGTAEDNHSSDITTGEVIKGQEGISTLAGFEKIFLPGSRLVIPGAGFFALNLDTAISSQTLVYEIEFDEIG